MLVWLVGSQSDRMTGRLKDELTAARSLLVALGLDCFSKQQNTSQVPTGGELSINATACEERTRWKMTQRKKRADILNLHLAYIRSLLLLFQQVSKSRITAPNQNQVNKTVQPVKSTNQFRR